MSDGSSIRRTTRPVRASSSVTMWRQPVGNSAVVPGKLVCRAASRAPSGLNASPVIAEALAVGFNVRSRFRLRASNSWTWPALSPTASRRPPGSTAALSTVASPARITPISAGLRSSVPSRLPRVRGVSSSATPWRASSSARSSWSSSSARAPSRCASAAVASRRAFPCWCSAIAPAITATTSSALTPASTARSRRCERFAAAEPSARNSRSVALRSASWVPAHSSAEASLAPR